MAQVFDAEVRFLQPQELIDRSVGKAVTILTQFGHEFRGILRGFDGQANCVLADAEEARPTVPDFPPRRHPMVLVNGSTISIVPFFF